MVDFGLAGVTFGLEDVKVGVWNGDGTYGTAVDVPSVQALVTALQTVNGRLEGDDIITAVHSKVISGTVTLRFGSVSQAVLEVLTGRTIETHGTTPNQIKRIRFTEGGFPYFGLCGKADAVEGEGVKHTFIPKCKIMEGFEARYEYGQWAIPELTCECLIDDTYATDNASEVQTVTITGTPTDGTFTLTFRGRTTANIDHDAAAAAVESALEALPVIGEGNVTVSGSAGGPYTVTFGGDLANTPLPIMTAADALTGGTDPGVTVAVVTEGLAPKGVLFEDLEYEYDQPVLLPPVFD